MINISQGQFSLPLTVAKIIAGVVLVNFMTIDIHTNHALEMINL